MRSKNLINNHGFTLVETLVALTVLLTVISAAFTAAFFGIKQSFFARDQVTAFYLVQEAMEYVRNARDTAELQGEDWDEYLNCGNSCGIDDPDNNWFSDGSEDLVNGFTRKIEFEWTNDNDRQVKVTVTVSWGGGDHQLEVSQLLFNSQRLPRDN